MELAVGAMGTLVPKLAELLHHEFVKQTGLKREVESGVADDGCCPR
jgi:hypothetical protein